MASGVEFRGALLGLKRLPKVNQRALPIVCSESCIIFQDEKDHSKYQIVGQLPFNIAHKDDESDFGQILCDLLGMKDIKIKCICISSQCMVTSIQNAHNQEFIVLIGNNEHGNLGISPSHKQYLDTPLFS